MRLKRVCDLLKKCGRLPSLINADVTEREVERTVRIDKSIDTKILDGTLAVWGLRCVAWIGSR